MCKNPVRCMCTKFQVNILKDCLVLVFCKLKTAIFNVVPWDFRILPICKCCPVWTVQEVFWGHFCVLDEKLI